LAQGSSGRDGAPHRRMAGVAARQPARRGRALHARESAGESQETPQVLSRERSRRRPLALRLFTPQIRLPRAASASPKAIETAALENPISGKFTCADGGNQLASAPSNAFDHFRIGNGYAKTAPTHCAVPRPPLVGLTPGGSLQAEPTMALPASRRICISESNILDVSRRCEGV
jgi:hypothetical protein